MTLRFWSKRQDEWKVLRDLATEYERLDPRTQDRIAERLAVLWDAFADRFGAGGFLESPEEERAAYLADLASAAGRMQGVRGTDLQHYFYSVAMMDIYARLFRESALDPIASRFADLVASLINRGRALRKEDA